MHHKMELDHIEGVLSMLQCLENTGLYCNLKKCKFHQKKMEFLGVNISSDGFKMEDKRIADVCDWECPTSVWGVCKFIGFINFYHQWIPGFTDITWPLHDLFQKNQSWQWTKNKQHAFELLKLQVSQVPVLMHTDPDKQFWMETDASNYAYGTVLSQKQPDNWHHLIGFMSKSMNLAECNYSILDKEALAIVKGLQNWRHWLKWTKLPIQILTNHKNLEYFTKPQVLNRRQMHWLELLTHYNYKIHYQPGDKNCVADALSWCAELQPPNSEDDKLLCLIPETKFTQIAACEVELTDSDWQDLSDIILTALTISDTHNLFDIHQLSQDWVDRPEGLEWEDGLGWKDGRIWILENDGTWRKVMELYHNSLVTGHLGTSGTTELVSHSYWWWNLPDWVKQYVQGCHTCRQAKHWNQWELGKLQPIPAPDGPWQWIQSDFMGELLKSDGFNVIYIVSDCLMKMAHFILMTTDISAPNLMKLHIHHIWKLHGIPLVHSTNHSSMFTANFTRNIYKELGIKPWFLNVYHPQTQGQVENNNKWMETYLQMLSHSIHIPNNSWLHSDISDHHTHYVTCITISIILETIPNINLGVINIVAVTLETSNTGCSLPPSDLFLETYCCVWTLSFIHSYLRYDTLVSWLHLFLVVPVVSSL